MDAHAIESVRWIITLVLGGLGLGLELRTKRIPNWLTLGALLPVVGAAFLVGVATETLEGWLLAGAVGVWLFQRNALAGGGVKMAALLGATSGLAGGAALAIVGLVLGVVGLLIKPTSKMLWQVPSTPIVLVTALAGLAVRALA